MTLDDTVREETLPEILERLETRGYVLTGSTHIVIAALKELLQRRAADAPPPAQK